MEQVAQDLANSSLAPSTKRVYASGQKRYLEFCKLSSLAPFPVSEEQLCAFVAHLAGEGLQHSSVKGHLSAIRHLQILGGMGDPFVALWPLLEYTLRGLKLRRAKCKSMRAKIRLPITPNILRQLSQSWEENKEHPDNIMLWAACCTCLFGFLRSGEVTVPSLKDYDPEAHLSEGDVALDNLMNPSVVRLHIKASKTDPFRKGVFVFLGSTSTELCPVTAVSAYLAVRGRESGPFFRFVSGVPLSREYLVRRVREALRSKGIDDTKYAGHSFRIGAATTAAAVGMEDSLIKALGRWESSAYLAYIRIPRERLVSVSRRLVVNVP